MFVWLRFTALSHPRRSRFRPLPASVMTAAVIVGFFASFYPGFILEHQFAMWTGSGQILPLIFFGVWGLVEQRSARQSWRAQSAVTHEA